MNLRKLTKTVAVSIGLGMAIAGVSSLATDNIRSKEMKKQSYKSADVKKSNCSFKRKIEKETEEVSAKKRKKSDSIHEKAQKIIEEELKRGVSKEYADYYSFLILRRGFNENRAKKYTDIYIKERYKGRSFEYANYYAKLRCIRGLEEIEARKETDIFLNEIFCGESLDYASYYAALIVEEGLSERQAREKASSHFMNDFEYEKEKIDSDSMLKEKEERKSEEDQKKQLAEVYYDEISKGRSKEYATYYSMLVVNKGLSEEEARRQVEISIKERFDEHKKKVSEYENYYTSLITMGLERNLARIQAEVYFKQVNCGVSKDYADYFAKMLVLKRLTVQNAKREASIFYDELKCGKSKVYASYFAELIVERNSTEGCAKRQADIFYEETKCGKSRIYADYYATLIVREGMEESQARKRLESKM